MNNKYPVNIGIIIPWMKVNNSSVFELMTEIGEYPKSGKIFVTYDFSNGTIVAATIKKDTDDIPEKVKKFRDRNNIFKVIKLDLDGYFILRNQVIQSINEFKLIEKEYNLSQSQSDRLAMEELKRKKEDLVKNFYAHMHVIETEQLFEELGTSIHNEEDMDIFDAIVWKVLEIEHGKSVRPLKFEINQIWDLKYASLTELEVLESFHKMTIRFYNEDLNQGYKWYGVRYESPRYDDKEEVWIIRVELNILIEGANLDEAKGIAKFDLRKEFGHCNPGRISETLVSEIVNEPTEKMCRPVLFGWNKTK